MKQGRVPKKAVFVFGYENSTYFFIILRFLKVMNFTFSINLADEPERNIKKKRFYGKCCVMSNEVR